MKLQYGGSAYCLENDVAIILNDKFLGGDKELKEVLESRYNYHMILDYQKEAIANFADFIKTSGVSSHVNLIRFFLASCLILHLTW